MANIVGRTVNINLPHRLIDTAEEQKKREREANIVSPLAQLFNKFL